MIRKTITYPCYAPPEVRSSFPVEIQLKCWPAPQNEVVHMAMQLKAKIPPEEGMKFLGVLYSYGYMEIRTKYEGNYRKIWKELTKRGVLPYRETQRFRFVAVNLLQEWLPKDRLLLTNPETELHIVDHIREIRLNIGTIYLSDEMIMNSVGKEQIRKGNLDQHSINNLRWMDQITRCILWAIDSIPSPNEREQDMMSKIRPKRITIRSPAGDGTQPYSKYIPEESMCRRTHSTPHPKQDRKPTTGREITNEKSRGDISDIKMKEDSQLHARNFDLQEDIMRRREQVKYHYDDGHIEPRGTGARQRTREVGERSMHIQTQRTPNTSMEVRINSPRTLSSKINEDPLDQGWEIWSSQEIFCSPSPLRGDQGSTTDPPSDQEQRSLKPKKATRRSHRTAVEPSQLLHPALERRDIRERFIGNKSTLYGHLFSHLADTQPGSNQCVFQHKGKRCMFTWARNDIWDKHYVRTHHEAIQEQLSDPSEANLFEMNGIPITKETNEVIYMKIPRLNINKKFPPQRCHMRDIEQCNFIWRNAYEEDTHMKTRHPQAWLGMRERQQPSNASTHAHQQTPKEGDGGTPTTPVNIANQISYVESCPYRTDENDKCLWVGNSKSELDDHMKEAHQWTTTEEMIKEVTDDFGPNIEQSLENKKILGAKELKYKLSLEQPQVTQERNITSKIEGRGSGEESMSGNTGRIESNKPQMTEEKQITIKIEGRGNGNESMAGNIKLPQVTEERQITAKIEGRGSGQESMAGNSTHIFDYSRIRSPLPNRSSMSLVSGMARRRNGIEIRSCPYKNCGYVYTNDNEETILGQGHIRTHLFENAESSYVKGIKKEDTKDENLTVTEALDRTQETNAYLLEQIFKLMNHTDEHAKRTDRKRIYEEMKLIGERNRENLKRCRDIEETPTQVEDNIVPVPDLSQNTQENIDNRDVRELPIFMVNSQSTSENTAFQLIQFLNKILSYIKQRRYTDGAGVLILTDRLQSSNGRNPAWEVTEMCIDYYVNKHNRQPTLKELTKNLEDRYCSELKPQNAMRRIDKITKEDHEDNNQFAYRISMLAKRAALTLNAEVREEWQENKSLELFISKISYQERNSILTELETRESIGKKPLNLYEAVNLLQKNKQRKEMYKEDPTPKPAQQTRSKNVLINQAKIEFDEEEDVTQVRNELKDKKTQTEPNKKKAGGPPVYRGPRGNGLEIDLYERQRQLEFRNRQNRPPMDTRDIQTPPIRQNFSFNNNPARRGGFNTNPTMPRQDRPKPNLNDREGRKQRLIDNKLANVEIGKCFKCGGNHSLFSPNCTKFNKPLAPEACKKCNVGCHYEEDCLYQFAPSNIKEEEQPKSRRIKQEDAIQAYWNHIGLI